MVEERRQEAAAVLKEAHALNQTVGELAAEFRAARIHDALLRRLVIGVTALALIGVVGGLVFALLLVHGQRQIDHDLGQGRAARASIALIKDCVDPHGACYRRNQQRTAQTVGQIVDANGNGKPDTQEVLHALHELERAQAKGMR